MSDNNFYQKEKEKKPSLVKFLIFAALAGVFLYLTITQIQKLTVAKEMCHLCKTITEDVPRKHVALEHREIAFEELAKTLD